jgi:hypothetical protein
MTEIGSISENDGFKKFDGGQKQNLSEYSRYFAHVFNPE